MIEVIKFAAEDVITSSTNNDNLVDKVWMCMDTCWHGKPCTREDKHQKHHDFDCRICD